MQRSYLDFLQREFSARLRKNPNYSLRAFARHLGIASSRLTEILKEKQGLSRKAAEGICRRLKLPPHESELFCDLVEARHARSELKRALARKRVDARGFQSTAATLDARKVALMAKWQNVALLELVRLEAFRNDPEWIASRLNLSPSEARQALSALLGAGLLEEKDGRLHPCETSTATLNHPPKAAVTELNESMLRKAGAALRELGPERRYIGSLIFSIDREELEEYKNLARKFFRDVAELSERSRRRDGVFNLSVQLFDLEA